MKVAELGALASDMVGDLLSANGQLGAHTHALLFGDILLSSSRRCSLSSIGLTSISRPSRQPGAHHAAYGQSGDGK